MERGRERERGVKKGITAQTEDTRTNTPTRRARHERMSDSGKTNGTKSRQRQGVLEKPGRVKETEEQKQSD